MPQHPLSSAFFDRDPQVVACDLIGKVLCHRVEGIWLKAMIVETEAYYRGDKASHASLGWTAKRMALFMPPGTVYMYYARGGDSFNVSCAGEGNAVLVKAGIPHEHPPDPKSTGENTGPEWMLETMHRLNPATSGGRRPPHRLCSGQTLLCRALGLRVPDWDQKIVSSHPLRLLDVGLRPRLVIRTTRLGIPEGRDGHLPYRFVHEAHAASATKNPLLRGKLEGRDYQVLKPDSASPAGFSCQAWDGSHTPCHKETLS